MFEIFFFDKYLFAYFLLIIIRLSDIEITTITKSF